MKRFATFETSSHFKFFDDFASKASISFDVVVVVALLLVVVVLRFLLRVFVLSFVFLHAVEAAQHEEDFFVVERVVAVVKVVVATMVVVTMKRSCDQTAFVLNDGKSPSPWYSQTKKESAEKEREREKKKSSGSGKVLVYKVSLPRSSLCFLSLTGERKEKKVSRY